MKAPDLILRCYAEKIDVEGYPQWHAFCLDLNLAVQADSFGEVRDKLVAVIAEYVYDVTLGEDKEHAEQLLNRKAPFFCWLKYYHFVLLHRVGRLHESVQVLLNQPMPLTPHGHNA